MHRVGERISFGNPRPRVYEALEHGQQPQFSVSDVQKDALQPFQGTYTTRHRHLHASRPAKLARTQFWELTVCDILQLAAGTGVDCSARHLPNDVTRLHFTQSEERKLNFQDDSRCRGDVPGEVRGAV